MQNLADRLDPSLLTRYLAGEATAAERAEVEQAAMEMSGEPLGTLTRAWEAAGAPAVSVATDDAVFLGRLMARVEAQTGVEKPLTAKRVTPRMIQGKRRVVSNTIRWGTAGVVAALAALLAVLSGDPASWSGRESFEQVYQTKPGQRAEFALPDGSLVTLGPASQLRYAEFERNGRRTIGLQGDAVFTIQHVSGRPFVVHAGAVTTKVLGTRFVIRAYPTDSSARVAVLDGKVAFGVGTPSTILVAGDVGTVADGGTLVQVTRDVALAEMESWARGEFVLDHASLRHIAAEMTRQYGVPVTVAETVPESRRLTVVFTGQSLSGMLDILARIGNVRHRYDGHTIVLDAS